MNNFSVFPRASVTTESLRCAGWYYFECAPMASMNYPEAARSWARKNARYVEAYKYHNLQGRKVGLCANDTFLKRYRWMDKYSSKVFSSVSSYVQKDCTMRATVSKAQYYTARSQFRYDRANPEGLELRQPSSFTKGIVTYLLGYTCKPATIYQIAGHHIIRRADLGYFATCPTTC